MAKHIIAGVLVVVILISAGLLGLILVPNTPLSLESSGPQITQTPVSAGGLQLSMQLSGQIGGGFFASDYNPSGNSTPITATVQADIVGGCASSSWQGSGWEVGQGYDAGWYAVWVTGPNGNTEPIGTQTGPKYLVNSFNQSSVASSYCYNPGGGDVTSPGGANFEKWTFSLPGQYQDFSVLHVSFITNMRYCLDYNHGGGLLAGDTWGQCQLGGYQMYADDQHDACAGNLGGACSFPVWGFNCPQFGCGPQGQAILRSGYSTLTPPGYTPYNNQTFAVGYSTGFDGGTQYSLVFAYPAVRGGKIIATDFVPQTSAGAALFTVPSGASSFPPGNCTASQPSSINCLWNVFSVKMYSGVFPTAVLSNVPIDIAPPSTTSAPTPSAPGLPSVSFTDKDGNQIPSVGDNLQLTFQAQAYTIHPVTVFLAQAWYNAGEPVPPVSNQYFALGTASGPATVPAGTLGSVSGAKNVSNYQGTSNITVSQAADLTVEVFAENGGAQASNPQFLNIQVLPAGCTTVTCQQAPQTLPATIGPILVSIVVIAIAVLVAYLLPVPLVYRILIVGGAVLVIIFAYNPLATAFATGAI